MASGWKVCNAPNYAEQIRRGIRLSELNAVSLRALIGLGLAGALIALAWVMANRR
jgi:hypothetical protein